MKRRKFLKYTLKGAGGLIVGGTVANEVIELTNPEPYNPYYVAARNINFSENLVSDTDDVEYTMLYDDDSFKIIIDEDTQTISFENPPEEGINIQDLHKMLQEEWESEVRKGDPPIIRLDNEA